MKIIKCISLSSLAMILGACTVTLTDETANSFIALATEGEYADKVEVSWVQTPYYKSYKVFRSESENGTYTALTDGNINEVVFNDTMMEIGKEYYYKVEAFNSLGIASFVTDPVKGYAGIGGAFSPPSGVVVRGGYSTKEILLRWNRVPEAYQYQILRSVDDLLYAPIAKVAHLRYSDTDVEAGVVYYYKISSIDKEGIFSADRSMAVKASLYGGDLGLSSRAGVYADKIVLTWNKIPYTETYSIYRSEQNHSGIIGNLIATIEDGDILTYEDSAVVPGKLYYYTIIYGNKTAKQTSSRIRSYLYTDSLPSKVQNFRVSQGAHANNVNISFDPVQGASAYEISRGLTRSGPWTIIVSTDKTTYSDRIPNDQYSYFYKVTALNPAPSPDSDVLEGWANKPPVNITASEIYGQKVVLSWDQVPGARQYQIEYADAENGAYQFAALVNADHNSRFHYEHIIDIGSNLSKDLFYKVSVISSEGTSLFSVPIKGRIKKIEAPKNIRLVNNRSRTKRIDMSWDEVPNAKAYAIYAATLSHRNSDPNRLQAGHFKRIGTSSNPAFSIAFGAPNMPPLYPIRRHVVMIKAVDLGDAEGVDTKTEIIYRLPVDLVDFAKDVDFTIIQAQTQIRNFGMNGSGGTVHGRAGGNYVYQASLSGSKNIWNNYASFEIVLNCPQTVTVNPSSMSATLNDTLRVSGLYSGTITYNSLTAAQGGYAYNGTITVSYNGVVSEPAWDISTAGGHLQSVVQQNVESPPRAPSYDPGGG